MSPTPKRSLNSTGRSVSPPPSKRKTSHLADQQNVPDTWPLVEIPTHVRIFSWNVNGIGPLLQKQLSFDPGSLPPLRLFLKRHQWPHLLCLQEVKISPRDLVAQKQLQHAANHGKSSQEPSYLLELSLPRDKYNATGFAGKVYGVASLIREDFASGLCVTRRPDWDLEGRVLIHEHESGVIIINGYWVNGTGNPYRDPVSGRVTGTRHDHKLYFHERILEETLRLERAGRQVVLLGDMNIARARIDGHPNLRTSPLQHVQNRADFNSKFVDDPQGMRGIDVFRHLHGDIEKFTYHPRGGSWGHSCDRVDLIIVSRALVDEYHAVTGSDIYDSPQERGHSDHVPLWVSVDVSKVPRGKAAQVPALNPLTSGI